MSYFLHSSCGACEINKCLIKYVDIFNLYHIYNYSESIYLEIKFKVIGGGGGQGDLGVYK